MPTYQTRISLDYFVWSDSRGFAIRKVLSATREKSLHSIVATLEPVCCVQWRPPLGKMIGPGTTAAFSAGMAIEFGLSRNEDRMSASSEFLCRWREVS